MRILELILNGSYWEKTWKVTSLVLEGKVWWEITGSGGISPTNMSSGGKAVCCLVWKCVAVQTGK